MLGKSQVYWSSSCLVWHLSPLCGVSHFSHCFSAVFGILMIVASAAFLFTPNTRGQPLVQTVDDLQWTKGRSIFETCKRKVLGKETLVWKLFVYTNLFIKDRIDWQRLFVSQMATAATVYNTLISLISLYFVNFCFCFWWFQMFTAKFWSHPDWTKIRKF